MYLHNSQQTTFSDNSRLFGGLPLDKDNRWVKLAGIIPWDLVENEYRKHFKSKRGGVAKSARLALGCLIAKEMLQLSDRDTVAMIRENPYIQYFLGYSCYQYKISLDPSLLTHFRKRFPADIIKLVNQWVIEADINSDSDSGDDESQTNSPDTCDKDAEKSEESGNRGTLILDATCAPQDIQYPTDVRLLHESRLKLELMMDTLQAGRSAKKPRNYRRKANKEYQRFCRNRRPRKNVIRQAVRAQLQYVRRDLRLIEEMRQDSTAKLSSRELQYLDTIKRLHRQQEYMYEHRTHRCDDRIVSIHQAYVRPIVRGKASAGTEFGAKITVSVVQGYAEVNTLSWDAYNESQDLPKACQQYKERYGHYPKRVLVDKIFRTRSNLQYCKKHSIHLNGPPLGRPPKDRRIYEEQIRLEREEAGERNAIEGKFGEGKRRYSLGLVMTKLQNTSETQIHLAFMVMNLRKILRDLLFSFFRAVFGLKTKAISHVGSA